MSWYTKRLMCSHPIGLSFFFECSPRWLIKTKQHSWVPWHSVRAVNQTVQTVRWTMTFQYLSGLVDPDSVPPSGVGGRQYLPIFGPCGRSPQIAGNHVVTRNKGCVCPSIEFELISPIMGQDFSVPINPPRRVVLKTNSSSQIRALSLRITPSTQSDLFPILIYFFVYTVRVYTQCVSCARQLHYGLFLINSQFKGYARTLSLFTSPQGQHECLVWRATARTKRIFAAKLLRVQCTLFCQLYCVLSMVLMHLYSKYTEDASHTHTFFW